MKNGIGRAKGMRRRTEGEKEGKEKRKRVKTRRDERGSFVYRS